MNKLARGSVAELIGTFLFVFIGIGSIIVAKNNPAAGILGIALAHGLALAMAITFCMSVSGGQINPAVSIALVVARKQDPKTAAAYIAAQLVGAACAAGMLQLLLGPETANAPGINLGATLGAMSLPGTWPHVMGIEILCTFFLMISVLGSVVDPRAPKLGGLPVGMTVAAAILFAGPLTGGSMNPARSFGPAVCGGHWTVHWVYWVGPIIGACLAALAYRAIWEAPAPKSGESYKPVPVEGAQERVG